MTRRSSLFLCIFLLSGHSTLAQRVTSGRTPAIWDLNARFIYDLPLSIERQSRLIIDVFHIASPQKAVDIDQKHYTYVDPYTGVPIGLNPFYGQAIRYQPAISVRLGMEVGF